MVVEPDAAATSEAISRSYVRRAPKHGVLHRVVREHLRTFLWELVFHHAIARSEVHPRAMPVAANAPLSSCALLGRSAGPLATHRLSSEATSSDTGCSARSESGGGGVWRW